MVEAHGRERDDLVLGAEFRFFHAVHGQEIWTGLFNGCPFGLEGFTRFSDVWLVEEVEPS